MRRPKRTEGGNIYYNIVKDKKSRTIHLILIYRRRKKLAQKPRFQTACNMGNHSLILTYALKCFINDESCLLIQHNSYFIRFK